MVGGVKCSAAARDQVMEMPELPEEAILPFKKFSVSSVKLERKTVQSLGIFKWFDLCQFQYGSMWSACPGLICRLQCKNVGFWAFFTVAIQF